MFAIQPLSSTAKLHRQAILAQLKQGIEIVDVKEASET
jgi:hypothetical protein